MNGTIYLIGKDGKLEEMSQQPYDKEDILQKYLADYPNLLAGDQMDEATPKRWLFISREVGLPKEEGGSDTWSLDHLFLDQDGIPTLVEVKRSSDTRSRREVVAQMLDYAANAVVYWPIDRIRACFETTCNEQGIDPIERLRELLGAEDSQLIEDFWEKTKTNLQAEKIRLVFVADQIQPEMRRIVEFLNGQMDPAEVLAVEIPQYVGKSQRAVVPRVIGLTAKAEAAKGKRTRTPKSIQEHLEGASKNLKDLFNALNNKIMEISSEIECYTTQAEIIYKTSVIFAYLAVQNKKGCLRYLIRTENDKLNDPKNITEKIPKTHGWGNITRVIYVYPDKINKEYTTEDIIDLIVQSYSFTQ